MSTRVGVDIDCSIWGPTELELQITAARRPGLEVSEDLAADLSGGAVDFREFTGETGTRVHAATVGDGRLTVRYSATVDGAAETAPAATDWEIARYRRPSRYCESDLVGTLARDIAGSTKDTESTVLRVTDWVAENLRYAPGVSGTADSATSTLIARRGVCRDYTHTVIALLRSIDIPARYTCVYAPGCDPMDLHAVAEVVVDGRWVVVDATRLAPRQSLVRIATGLDAADVSFLTNYGGVCNLHSISVHAAVDGGLPVDDTSTLVSLD